MPIKPEKAAAELSVAAINKELMRVVTTYRLLRDKTQEECAQRIGKHKTTYNMMEKGSNYILAGELELLIKFLQIPRHELWPPDASDDWALIINREKTDNGKLRILVEIDPEQVPKT